MMDKMEHFVTLRRVIMGDLQPHKIGEEDLSLINQEFNMVMKESGDSFQIEPHRYLPLLTNKTVIISIDEESNKLTIAEHFDEYLEDINFDIAPPESEKDKSYFTLLEFEDKIIRNSINSFIDGELDAKKLELFALKNIYELKKIAENLCTYKKHLPIKIYKANEYVINLLKDFIIKLIIFIQDNFSHFFSIHYKTEYRLRYELFGDDYSSIYRSPQLSIFPCLPKEDKYDRLKECYIEDLKEHQKNKSKFFKDFDLSFGEYAFNFYKVEFQNNLSLYKKEKLFWEKLLITKKLEIFQIDKIINNPEIEKILIPLMDLEIRYLEGENNENISSKEGQFDFNKLTKAIMDILVKMLKRSPDKEAENFHNDYLYDFLQERNYTVDNQARTGNQLMDIEIQETNGTTISIIEGLRLSYLNKKYIYDHLYKLINVYDKSGNPINYLIIYAENNEYVQLWKKYLNFLKEINNYKNGINYSIVEVKDRCEEVVKSDIFFAETIHDRNNSHVSVYHIFVNIRFELSA